MRNCYARARHMEETTGALWHIYTNCLIFEIRADEGYVSYGLGADISILPCLATGIWNLAPKATSGPKSRGPSFGTTLWRHVQRYCAHFPPLMQMHSGFTFSCRLRFLKYNTFDCFQKLKERRFSRFSKSFYFSFIRCYYFTPFSHWKINNGSSLLK